MNITPEVIEALRTLRDQAPFSPRSVQVRKAIDTLDNAGFFREIDEATGYDVSPTPVKVSKCTCQTIPGGSNAHRSDCPGDPAEWGDMAYTTKKFSDLTDEELEA